MKIEIEMEIISLVGKNVNPVVSTVVNAASGGIIYFTFQGCRKIEIITIYVYINVTGVEMRILKIFVYHSSSSISFSSFRRIN